MSMRVGHLWRLEDESGVSGLGRVAEWVEYSDGEVVLHWLSHTPSTNHYRNMKQMEQIHGHEGQTEIRVDWESPRPRTGDEDEEETTREELADEIVAAAEELTKKVKQAATKTAPEKKPEKGNEDPATNNHLDEEETE